MGGARRRWRRSSLRHGDYAPSVETVIPWARWACVACGDGHPLGMMGMRRRWRRSSLRHGGCASPVEAVADDGASGCRFRMRDSCLLGGAGRSHGGWCFGRPSTMRGLWPLGSDPRRRRMRRSSCMRRWLCARWSRRRRMGESNEREGYASPVGHGHPSGTRSWRLRWDCWSRLRDLCRRRSRRAGATCARCARRVRASSCAARRWDRWPRGRQARGSGGARR